MQYIFFNFMIFNNAWNFNKYLLWLFYCIFNYNLKVIIHIYYMILILSKADTLIRCTYI